jgi:cytoskeletal protein RodZ
MPAASCRVATVVEPVGERLRKAREAQELSLGTIAQATKISVTALTALERGDVTRLPGGIFGRSFVRAYALEVGLDPDAIVRDFIAEVAEAERDSARRLIQAPITPDDREFAARQRRALVLLRRTVIVLAVLALLGLIWGVWAWRSGGDDSGVPSGLDVAPLEAPPPTSPAVQLPEAPVPPAQAAALLRVTVRVSADCWIRATADGLVVHERQLSAGQAERFTAQRELVLDVGNAGAVTWTINDRDAKPLGAAGQRQVVRLTLDNYESYLR